MKQETVSGSGISWAICKFAPRSRLITTPAPHHSVFTGWMPFLPPNQQRQSTEGGLGSDLSGNYGNRGLDGVRIGVIRRIRLNDPGGDAA